MLVEKFNSKIMVFELTRPSRRFMRGSYGELIVSMGDLNVALPHNILRGLSMATKYLSIDSMIKYIKLYIGKPDLVVSTIPPPESVYIGFHVARYFSSRYMIDFHDILDEWKIYESRHIALLIRSYYELFVYKYARKADIIVTTTEYASRILSYKLGRNDIIVVHNGVDPSEFVYAYNIRTSCRHEGDTVIFVGNLSWKYHNLDRFIKALPLIAGEGIDIRLKVVGEGALRRHYMSLAEKLGILNKLVFFKGYLPREKLYHELGSSDYGLVCRPGIKNLWILSSDRITLYEYLASGLPVIVYGPPNTYLEKIVKEFGLGIYISSDDPNVIAENIVNNLDRLRRISPKHVREYIIRFRSWDRIMECFSTKLAEMLR